MPDESIRERDLKALEAELAEMVEWQHAHLSTNEVLLYT